MAILYDGLWAELKRQNKNPYYLRKNGISPTIIAKMQKGEGGIETRTIDKICSLLECQPGDIMRYVPDDNTDTK